jgi:hypothetical protein
MIRREPRGSYRGAQLRSPLWALAGPGRLTLSRKTKEGPVRLSSAQNT